MIKALPKEDTRDKSLDMCGVLHACEDFATELKAMEELLLRWGDIVLFTPKGHPEIAGLGIEVLPSQATPTPNNLDHAYAGPLLWD